MLQNVLLYLSLVIWTVFTFTPQAYACSLLRRTEITFDIPNDGEDFSIFYLENINWDGNPEILIFDGDQVMRNPYHEELVEDMSYDGVPYIAIGLIYGHFYNNNTCQVIVTYGFPMDSTFTRNILTSIHDSGGLYTDLAQFGALDLNRDSFKELFLSFDSSKTKYMGAFVSAELSWMYEGFYYYPDSMLFVFNGLLFSQLTDVTELDDLSLPNQFSLGKPFPNPFNATQTIPLTVIPGREVKVEAYNLLGQKVADIYTGRTQSAELKISWNANQLPSGVYFIKATSGQQTAIVKTILLK